MFPAIQMQMQALSHTAPLLHLEAFDIIQASETAKYNGTLDCTSVSHPASVLEAVPLGKIKASDTSMLSSAHYKYIEYPERKLLPEPETIQVTGRTNITLPAQRGQTANKERTALL